MISEHQFKVLRCCAQDAPRNQRQISELTELSLGTVNSSLKSLRADGLVDDQLQLTSQGEETLDTFRVDNAIIMAAGLSSRFAPISYEKPKGVLVVRGEVLIERQIRQLRAAGIKDIIVVVGYKKEEFFYLAEEFDVEIVVNPDYASRNNNSTIKRVEHLLGNSYICSSDDYFTENPFERYVYRAYYSAVYEEGETPEYCLKTSSRSKLITAVEVGGHDSWVMLGHVYWDRAFSQAFCRILNKIYDEPATAGKLWEDIFREHLSELPMVMRCYEHGIIWEFDSLDELKAFDGDFINNVDSEIMDNICQVLKCSRSDIEGIIPIKQGLTNLSFKFQVAGKTYVYRHPGQGTDAIINRESEAISQRIGAELGLDDTFIYEDAEKGWKISYFIENCTLLDYHNWDQVAIAMDMARTLHGCQKDTGYSYDVFKNACEIVEMLDAKHCTSFKDFGELQELAATLNEKAQKHGARICLCHNDFYFPNFLITENEGKKGLDRYNVQLIDWEYSGMSDYAVDLGVFICCSDDYEIEDAQRVYEMYFQRPLTPVELFHCTAYTALASYYWFVWALYKDACGDPVGEFLYLWYRMAKRYGRKALELANQQGI